MAIDILKEVNRIPRARLTYLDGDVAQGTFPISDTSQFEPGKEIEIKLRYEGESDRERTVFKGLITQHRVEMDARG
ncbi:Rhs element Vgr protein, partial [Candidatus Entotheonella serta]